ncbi:MAG: hypothetical protein A2Y33_16650 [Spirochaetes bacterium GWF1_51_8]|nr:MAG: hypothetical protein A2Y33_16650 [Spirochaetes bacterium GWF1_51_8]
MKKIVLSILFFFPIILFAGPGFYIKDYNVFLEINDDGTIDIHEKILAHFTEEKQGIFRKMPLKGSMQVLINEEWNTYFWDWEYSDIHTDKETKIWNEDGYTIIRMGTLGKYISGDIEYNIYYRVYGAYFTENKENDYLYWVVIGDGWDVRINSVSFTVNFPDKLKVLENIDYSIQYGATGSQKSVISGSDVEENNDGQSLVYNHTGSLNAYEGIKLLLKLKKGLILQNQNNKAITISAIELFNVYNANQKKANNYYLGKNLYVYGCIKEIGDDYIYLMINESGQNKTGWVTCYFSHEDSEILANLNTGDLISIKGVCKGKEGYIVNIEKAIIIYREIDNNSGPTKPKNPVGIDD